MKPNNNTGLSPKADEPKVTEFEGGENLDNNEN